MTRLRILHVALVLGALQLVSACANEKSKVSARLPPDTTRLALARRDMDLVLIEVDLQDGTSTTLTSPIAGWFNTVESYSRGGPSAILWANRGHTRAVMFGGPHDGSEEQLNVLRGEQWERWPTLSLQGVSVSPNLTFIVTSSAERSELFTESVLTLFDYEGEELLSVEGRQGLSTVAIDPGVILQSTPAQSQLQQSIQQSIPE